MSIRHDSPAWFRRIRDEGGPVAQGRAVPLREGVPVPLGRLATAQPPQAAHAPPAAPETVSKPRPIWRCTDCNKPTSAADAPDGDVCRCAERRFMRTDPLPQPQDPIVAKVCALLLSRSAVGIAKYGTTLARTDLTRKQWLIHMRDELLDGALYAQRMIEMEDGE